MKKILNYLSSRIHFGISLILVTMLFCISSCDKSDDNNCSGIDCLPPATQTGAGTFGCLVNGEPFIDNSDEFNCFYQLIDGEYFFGIQAEDNVQNIAAIAIGSLKKQIQTGERIQLNLRGENEFYALIDFDTLRPEGSTNQSDDGFIIFNEFNTNSNVVSATFEFTITDPTTGTVYNVTEGRFDSQFTQ